MARLLIRNGSPYIRAALVCVAVAMVSCSKTEESSKPSTGAAATPATPPVAATPATPPVAATPATPPVGVDLQEKVFGREVEPIEYVRFFVLVKTGIEAGNPYGFNACLKLSDTNWLYPVGKSISSEHSISGVRVPSVQLLDEKSRSIVLQALEKGQSYCGPIVAGLSMNGDVAIYRLY